MPWFGREINQPGEQRVTQDADGHRPDPADFVAQPAEDNTPGGRAEQEGGGDVTHPDADERVGRRQAMGGLHRLQGGSGDERKNAHFQTIEHPS